MSSSPRSVTRPRRSSRKPCLQQDGGGSGARGRVSVAVVAGRGRARRRVTLLLLSLLASAPLVSHSGAPVTIVARERLDGAAFDGATPTRASHRLVLGAVVLEATGWTRDEVLDGLGAMAGLLAQCGIRLDAVDLLTVDAPAHIDLHTPTSRRLAAALDPPRPTLYFVRDTRQQPAFDAEAVGRGNSRTRPEMRDSVWVTRAAPDLPIVLAHELVHVLANSGEHVALPGNLMREASDPRHTQLTGAQCAAMLETGTGHGLLIPTE